MKAYTKTLVESFNKQFKAIKEEAEHSLKVENEVPIEVKPKLFVVITSGGFIGGNNLNGKLFTSKEEAMEEVNAWKNSFGGPRDSMRRYYQPKASIHVFNQKHGLDPNKNFFANAILNNPENKEIIKEYGLEESLDEGKKLVWIDNREDSILHDWDDSGYDEYDLVDDPEVEDGWNKWDIEPSRDDWDSDEDTYFPESFIEEIRLLSKHLNEAPMSPEDAADSKVLRDLYNKIGGKKYTKFTPEEETVLKKYGLDAWGFRGDTKINTPGKHPVVKGSDLGTKYYPNKDFDKINLADRARKTDSRDWGRKYNSSWTKNPVDNERSDQANQMRKPLSRLSYAKRDYQSDKKRLDNYEKDLNDRIGNRISRYDKEVADATKQFDFDDEYHNNGVARAEKRINDILAKHKKTIESFVEKLDEASMSDEDRADTKVLKNILYKLDNRKNAALTPEEKAVLDKYGLQKGYGNLVDKDFRNYYSMNAVKNSNYNLADKIRKADRTYGKEVRSNSSAWGDRHKKTFQDRERENDARVMGQDVADMKDALSDKKYHARQVQKNKEKYLNLRNRLATEKDDAIAKMSDKANYDDLKAKADKSLDKLNAVRKDLGLPTQESLNEDAEKRTIKTVGDPKLNRAIVSSIIGQISDGIWENSPAMEGYWYHANAGDNGEIIVDTRDYSSRKNPYIDMSDDEIRKYFANKAKYIAQLDMHDHNINPYKNWNENNNEESNYMSFYGELDHDPTFAEIYRFYKDNK